MARTARSDIHLKKLSRIAEQLGTVRREGLTEQLVDKLESLALRGAIAPGERLPPERELAVMLNVSRSSLRQALKALQVMGVLEVRQGSGNYLSENAREILRVPPEILVPLRGLSQAELFEVRRAMEAEGAAAASQRANKADLQKMRAELERMHASLGNRFVYARHDIAFHHAIALASGNRFFIWFLALANKVLYSALLSRPMKRSIENSLHEHERILEAIEARNAERARLEMLGHVDYQKYYMLDEKKPADTRFLAYDGSTPPAGREQRRRRA